MKQTGMIVKGNGLDHEESITEAHIAGYHTRDMGAYVEVGHADRDFEPTVRPLYYGYGQRYGAL